MLMYLLYCSERDMDVDIDLRSLLTKAIDNNRRHAVTGMLWYDGRNFVQILEGARDTINPLYALIMQDCRHKHVQLLAAGEIVERSFSAWAMGLAHDASPEQPHEMVLKYAAHLRFDPASARSDSVMAMMRSLSQQL